MILDRNRQVCIVQDMEKQKPYSEARQRILETADRLFYQEGLHAVGIDRIIAEAKVAKMTLYAHFASKDDLILAVLKHREGSLLAFFRSAMERHGKGPKDQLQAFFGALKELVSTPGFRGCPFQNAAAEVADPDHAIMEFVRDNKRRFHEMLRGFVIASVGKKGEKVAQAISILVEGAITTAVIYGTPEAVDVAWNAAEKLLLG